jgi:hypothetical protein
MSILTDNMPFYMEPMTDKLILTDNIPLYMEPMADNVNIDWQHTFIHGTNC